MAMIWDSKVYACGHKEWKYPSALSSRDLYEWATKNTPDLCSWCRVLLLQQRLNYFNNAREKLGDFPARQLLLQIIDAKSYAPANAFLFLLNQWVFGATQRLDGPDDEASSEVARVLAALDGARDGALVLRLMQITRRKNHLYRLHQEQNANFHVRWATLEADDREQQRQIYETIDPTLMCAQMSGATAAGASEGATTTSSSPSEEKKPGEKGDNTLSSRSDNTLESLLHSRPWNPQVRALLSRLREALKHGDFKATFDEEMTNAEEALETLLGIQGSIAAGDLRAKGGILSQPSLK